MEFKPIHGANAALKLATSGALGKRYNESLFNAINRRMETNNPTTGMNGSSDDEYATSPDAPTSVGYAAAIVALLTEEEQKWYRDRGNLLLSKHIVEEAGRIFDIEDRASAIPFGFNVDIPDDLEYLSFMVSSDFPLYKGGDNKIPESFIKAGSQLCFASAALIELLLFIHDKNYNMSGGFGTWRAMSFENAGKNLTGVSSGTPQKRTYITDHAFGRGFDIDLFINQGDKFTNIGSSQREYIRQLDLFLSVLNTAPEHLLPDYIKIGNWCPDEYTKDPGGVTPVVGKMVEKYSKLKYVKIAKDAPDDATHRSHIHISFSPARAGKYTGSNGRMTMSSLGTFINTSPQFLNMDFYKNNLPAKVDYARLSKSFYNDESSMTDLEVFYLLNQYGNFSEEISAIFTALAYREANYRPYIANTSGFIGLWQIGTRIKNLDGDPQGGLVLADLSLPQSQKGIAMWKLAYANWETEQFTEATIDAKLREVQKQSNNYGLEYYDQRVWIPINQVYLLRSKIAQKDVKKKIETWGLKTSSSLGGPWGDTYLPNGFIAGLSFKVAADVYQKATGKSTDDLKKWVLANIPQDSPTRKKDSQYGIPKIEVWVDLSKYTSQVMATPKKALYKQLEEGLY